jgi:hypothetical protein
MILLNHQIAYGTPPRGQKEGVVVVATFGVVALIYLWLLINTNHIETMY